MTHCPWDDFPIISPLWPVLQGWILLIRKSLQPPVWFLFVLAAFFSYVSIILTAFLRLKAMAFKRNSMFPLESPR